MKLKPALLLAGLALAGANAMACYTVYDANSRVVYQGAEAPVDMSLQLHDALAQRGYPRGSRMQFDRDSCGNVPAALGQTRELPANTVRITREQAVSKASEGPLLTEPATATRLGMPHTVIANNIAVVPAGAARDMGPAVTVVPAESVVYASAPNTAAMGAGSGTSAHAPAARSLTVITEYRNGQRTVQRY